MMSRRPTLALAAVALFIALLTGCEPTTLRFENQVPGARLENLRWRAPGTTYQSLDTLLPGQTSAEVSINPADEGETGDVSFEINLNGRRVALTAEAPLTIDAGEQARFVLTADTPVRHPLLAETTLGLWADAPEPE